MMAFRTRAVGLSQCVGAHVKPSTRFLPAAGVRCFSVDKDAGDKMTSGGMYNWRVEAVNNALAKRGKATGPLTVEDLTSLGHLDQYHYLGVDACDELISILGLDSSVKVLDIGSGIGGPARYLSMKSACDVTGVELQSDLADASTDLTKRVGLDDRVRFVTGDFVSSYRAGDSRLQPASFDHMVSLLVFLHIPGRADLLKTCYESLKPDGTFLIEDFALIGKEFTAQEDSWLKNVVTANTVTSGAQYTADLEAAGFTDIDVVDLSETWTEWTKARHVLYRASKDQTIQDHGEKVFTDRVAFYEVIDSLFAGRNLGGVRITGRKRGEKEEKLYRGRLAAAAHEKKSEAVLNEYGSTVQK